VLVPQLAQLSAPTGALGLTTTGAAAAAAAVRGDDEDSLPEAFALSPFAPESVVASGSSVPLRREEIALLYVGQPEHALEPPVPSQRPSPGHVPPTPLEPRPLVEGVVASATSGELGLGESSEPLERVLGSAGEAVRLRDIRDGGRGTRLDLRSRPDEEALSAMKQHNRK
jgi:hypothetical protein